MFRIKKVNIKNYKIIDDLLVDLTPLSDNEFPERKFNCDKNHRIRKQISSVNEAVIYGRNAYGKTTLLEGIKIGWKLIKEIDFEKFKNIFFTNKINMFKKNPKNIFWAYEIVSEKYIYNINLEISFEQNNQDFIPHIINEKLTYRIINDTNIGPEKIIYSKEKGLITSWLNQENFNKEINVSCFSFCLKMINTPTINKESDLLKEHYDLFNKFKIIINLKDELNFYFAAPMRLDEDSYRNRLYKEMLKLSDPLIEEIFINKKIYSKEIFFKFKDNKQPIPLSIAFTHRFSSGTKNIIRIMGFIAKYIRDPYCVLLIDEIDAGVHTDFIDTLFSTIFDHHDNQLIFTTHNTNFFRLGFRSDQILLIESASKITKISNHDKTTDNYSRVWKVKYGHYIPVVPLAIRQETKDKILNNIYNKH